VTEYLPQQKPIGDDCQGYIVRDGAVNLLTSIPIDGLESLTYGFLTVRYGICYAGRPHLSIVPGLVVMDYGEVLTGEDAWAFLIKRSNLFPRAEVFGYRNDGAEDIITVRMLDLAIPPDVLVFTNATATTPLASIKALIDPSLSSFPERLRLYLPIFPTYKDWQHESEL